jgi:hypothetical protein
LTIIHTAFSGFSVRSYFEYSAVQNSEKCLGRVSLPRFLGALDVQKVGIQSPSCHPVFVCACIEFLLPWPVAESVPAAILWVQGVFIMSKTLRGVKILPHGYFYPSL